jgi:hypothetical protein
MNNTIREYSNGSRNPNENIFMEVSMIVVFVTIIIWSAIILIGV